MSDNLSIVTDPFAVTALDEATELRALSQALRLAQGFKLIFVRCNQPLQRRNLIAAVRAELPELNAQEINFNEPITHLLDELRGRIAEPPPDALFVSGLEYSLPVAAEADATPLVANLNASRNSFPQVMPCPLVLWMPEYILNAIINGAPDFFSIRSGVYFFAATPGDTSEIADTLTAGTEWAVEGLSLEEKQERIEAIKSLLADYESLSDSQRSYDREMGLHWRLGNLFLKIGNLSLARKHYEQLMMLARKLEDREGEGLALTGLGHIYYDQRRVTEATKAYQQALDISRDVKNREKEGLDLMNLGNVYFDQGNLIEAEKFYQQGLEIIRDIGNRSGEARVLSNLGNIYKRQKRLPEAEEFHQQSLRISHEIGDLSSESSALNNLGNVYNQLGRWTEAEKLYQDSLAIDRKIGDLVGQGGTLRNLSRLWRERGDLMRALEFAQKAVEILKLTEDMQELAAAQELLAELQQEVESSNTRA
jgi:tetratricopeptide (TPR) repeat protein